jgi:hypothetical protein
VSSSESIVTRLRGCFAARDETRTAPGECPDAQTIWDAAHGVLDSEETERLVDHFVVCPSCAADWRIAMSPDSQAATEEVELRARRTIVNRAAIATAAAILLVAVVAVYRWVAPLPSEPVYRATDSVIQPLTAVDATLPRDAAVLRWTSAGDDALYSVQVGKTDLTPLASAHDLKETEFAIPPEALEGLESGEVVVWQVEALLPDGRTVVSEAFVNRVE